MILSKKNASLVYRWYFGKSKQKKPSEEDFINSINDIWFNENYITKEQIIKSFKITGISSNLDGSENILIKHNEEIGDEIIVPNDVLQEKDNDIDIIEEKKTENIKIESNPKITDYFHIINKMDLEN